MTWKKKYGSFLSGQQQQNNFFFQQLPCNNALAYLTCMLTKFTTWEICINQKPLSLTNGLVTGAHHAIATAHHIEQTPQLHLHKKKSRQFLSKKVLKSTRKRHTEQEWMSKNNKTMQTMLNNTIIYGHTL